MSVRKFGIGLVLIVLILFFLFFILNGKSYITSEEDTKIEDKNETEFVVIYSSAMEEGVDIVEYNFSGNILNKKNFKDGRALYYTTKFNDKYYITSERQNRHYIWDQTEGISTFFGPTKYDEDIGIGSSFAKSSNEYLFFSMNVGTNPKFSPNEYSNELVYLQRSGSDYKNIMLPGYFQSVIEKDNKGYVLYLDGEDNSMGISVIDLIKNTKISDFSVNNHENQGKGFYPASINNGSSLQLFNDRLLLFLDGNRSDIQYKPIMQIINPLDGSLEKEISISKETFSLFDSIVYNDKLYLISEDAKIMVWNSSIQEEQMIQLKQDQAFLEKQKAERGYISGVQISGDSIYLLYDFVNNKPINRDREIRRYNLQNGTEEAVISLNLQSDKEMVRFFINDGL